MSQDFIDKLRKEIEEEHERFYAEAKRSWVETYSKWLIFGMTFLVAIVVIMALAALLHLTYQSW